MKDKLFLKPGQVGNAARGRSKRTTLIVRDPINGRQLADDGEYKPASVYWLRRLRCGDVVRARPATASKASAAPAKKGGE